VEDKEEEEGDALLGRRDMISLGDPLIMDQLKKAFCYITDKQKKYLMHSNNSKNSRKKKK
jgi:hypothetical protein